MITDNFNARYGGELMTVCTDPNQPSRSSLENSRLH
jgi:hypothetical protein